jgi:hypothetical protein
MKLTSIEGRRSTRLGRGMGRLAALAVLVTVIATACGSSSSSKTTGAASGASAAPKTLNLIVAGLSQSYMQAYIAQADGAFANENLTVNIKSVSPGVIASTIVGGQADLAMSGTSTLFPLVKNGKDTVAIYQTATNGISGYVVGSPKVKSVKDCTKFATAQQGSTAYAWAEKYKDIYKANYSIQQLADTGTISAAVAAGSADCANGAKAGFDSQLASKQVVTLVDPANTKSLPSNFPKPIMGGVIWGLKETVSAKRDAVTSFLRAMQKTFDGPMKKDSIDQLATFMRKSSDFQGASQASMVTAVQELKPYIAPNNGEISTSDWNDSLQWSIDTGQTFLSLTDPLWSFKQRVDMSYYNDATS